MKHPPWKISNKSSMLSIAPKLLQHKSSQLYYEFNLPLKTSAFNYLMLCKKIHSNDWINLANSYPVIYIYTWFFLTNWAKGKGNTNKLQKKCKMKIIKKNLLKDYKLKGQQDMKKVSFCERSLWIYVSFKWRKQCCQVLRATSSPSPCLT